MRHDLNVHFSVNPETFHLCVNIVQIKTIYGLDDITIVMSSLKKQNGNGSIEPKNVDIKYFKYCTWKDFK